GNLKQAVGDVLLLLADDPSELERERCGDRYGARNALVIMQDLCRARRSEHTADDVAGVIVAPAADTEFTSCASRSNGDAGGLCQSTHAATARPASVN